MHLVDSKSITDNIVAKADIQTHIEEAEASHKSTMKALMANEATTPSFNASDWLMKFFDVRKDAHAGNIVALQNAKAVLSGDEFSWMS